MTEDISESDEIEIDNDPNPFFAKVVGFINPNGELVKQRSADQFKLLINVGSDDDVKIGERVLIFALGQEVIDPDSGEGLGCFEVVRGEGKVFSVQRRMAVVRSTKTTVERRKKPVGSIAAAMGQLSEIELITVDAPFTNPAIGDLVRFI